MANSTRTNIVIGAMMTAAFGLLSYTLLTAFWYLLPTLWAWLSFLLVKLGMLISVLFTVVSAYLLVKDIIKWFKKRNAVRG